MAGDAGCTRAQARCARESASFETQVLQGARIIRPVLAHFHPQLKMHAPAETYVVLEPRRASDPLQALAFGANYDRLLSRPVHPDRGIDDELPVLLRSLF